MLFTPRLIVCLISISYLTSYAAGLECYDCRGDDRGAGGCVRWTTAPGTDTTCDQCLTTVYYGREVTLRTVERGCQFGFPDTDDVCVFDSDRYRCSCSSAKCNNVQISNVTCHACAWYRDSGYKDFCKTGVEIPEIREIHNCFSCSHTETYDDYGVLESVTRGCGRPDDEIGCVRDGTDYKCTCTDEEKCNTKAAVTRTCQHCDWYHGRSDSDNCRYGTENKTKTNCFQCSTIEAFADDKLVRVERDCAEPGNEDDENCDEADNLGGEAAALLSWRTCTCMQNGCNDVSAAAGVASSVSMVIIISFVMILV